MNINILLIYFRGGVFFCRLMLLLEFRAGSHDICKTYKYLVVKTTCDVVQQIITCSPYLIKVKSLNTKIIYAHPASLVMASHSTKSLAFILSRLLMKSLVNVPSECLFRFWIMFGPLSLLYKICLWKILHKKKFGL